MCLLKQPRKSKTKGEWFWTKVKENEMMEVQEYKLGSYGKSWRNPE
jgi:hypothetical protein